MWLRVLIFAVLAYLLWQVIRGLGAGGGGRSRFKCADCRSCGKLFDDGVLCRFNGKETFKNETHIGNCVDYQRR